MIRNARESDIPRLVEIRAAVRENQLRDASRVTFADYQWFIANPGIFVWEQGDRIVGFSAAAPETEASGLSLWIKPMSTKPPKPTRLELQILEALWAQGKASVREILETFPEPRPAYTTIQTTVYRMERKKAVWRVRKIGNAHIFEPAVPRDVARNRLLDEILSFFGGRAQPMMAQLAEAGKLTLEDVRELEKTIQKLGAKKK